MADKIQLRESKTLKLSNLLVRKVPENELMDLQRILHMMNSYILSKGIKVVGPLINYSAVKVDDEGKPHIVSKMMLQLSESIEPEEPYEFKSIIKQENCLFARFEEREEKLKYAYQKLGVFAFENDIELRGGSYTVFVDRKEDGTVLADIFMPLQR